MNDLPARSAERSPERSRRQQARLVMGIVLSGLGVAFALLNLDEVGVNWIVGTWDTPLIVVIAVSVLVGAGLGFLVGRQRRPG
ncbi:MAG TPA: hypothetical protein VHF45_03020 [Thermoleophilaceae bacterium]|jgi:uncharacterized integral membrane protein|nr:hypothetical protein [Thermoleophilaceae bacterium]